MKINLIKKDTDLSILRPVNLDLVIYDNPYDVYQAEGFIHTIGGKWGHNDYWACPSGGVPSYENLIQFSGLAPMWGVTFEEKNYISNKWDEREVRSVGNCWITRNDKKFYRVEGRDISYALSKAQYYLVRLQEGPINLNQRNWVEKTVGRKVWYRDQPAVITFINEHNELWIKPDGIEKFTPPAGWGSLWNDYEEGLFIDLLEEKVDWFRD